MKEVHDKPPDSGSIFKQARGVKGVEIEKRRKPVGGSFKSKLLSMGSSSSWSGFVANREKLNIARDDAV
ncbi:hypothetical protein ACOSP7_020868 [Xanthoceras sorbifolium]